MTIQKYTTQLFSISANEQRKSDTYYFKVLKEQDKWMCCWLSSHEQGSERLWASEEPEAGGPSLLFVMLSRWSWSYCQPGKASVPWQPLFLQHCSFNWRPSLLVSWVAVARFHVKALPMKTKKHQNKQKPGINWSEYPEHLGDTKWSCAIYSKLNTAVPEPLSGINRCSPSVIRNRSSALVSLGASTLRFIHTFAIQHLERLSANGSGSLSVLLLSVWKGSTACGKLCLPQRESSAFHI